MVRGINNVQVRANKRSLKLGWSFPPSLEKAVTYPRVVQALAPEADRYGCQAKIDNESSTRPGCWFAQWCRKENLLWPARLTAKCFALPLKSAGFERVGAFFSRAVLRSRSVLFVLLRRSARPWVRWSTVRSVTCTTGAGRFSEYINHTFSTMLAHLFGASAGAPLLEEELASSWDQLLDCLLRRSGHRAFTNDIR